MLSSRKNEKTLYLGKNLFHLDIYIVIILILRETRMTELSYATKRKLRIIQERLGDDWRDDNPEISIDALYNQVVGDRRRNLFCKIDPDIKSQLDEMADSYDVKMAELVERLVQEEYRKFVRNRAELVNDLASQFAGKR